MRVPKNPYIPSGSDASVVRRQQQMTGTCWHFAAYFTVPSLAALISFAFFGSLAAWLAGARWGRALLLRYPRLFTRGLFSKQGPTEEQMRETGFEKTLIVHGETEHPGLCCVVLLVRVAEAQPWWY